MCFANSLAVLRIYFLVAVSGKEQGVPGRLSFSCLDRVLLSPFSS